MPISTGRLRLYSVGLGILSLPEVAAAAIMLAAQPRHWVLPVTASYPGMVQPVIPSRVDIDQGVVWVLGITAVGALLPAVPAYFSRWSSALSTEPAWVQVITLVVLTLVAGFALLVIIATMTGRLR